MGKGEEGEGGGGLADKELREVVDGYAKQLSNSRQELNGFSWDKVFGMDEVKRQLQEFGKAYGVPGNVGMRAPPRSFLFYG